MTEMFTIELSDETVRRVKEAADRTGQPVDAILSEWIERSALAAKYFSLMTGVESPIYTPLGNKAAAALLMEVLRGSG